VNSLDLKLKWSSVDNYILVAAGVLAAVAAGINDVSAAFIVLAVGMILKATASAIYPNATLTDNLDNIALATAGVLATLTTLTNNPTWALAIMAAGGFLKAVGSAYTRGANISDNIDNVILAATTALSGSLLYFGLAQYAFIIASMGALAKGILSTYFRNKASA
jgi:hypothetical protein